MAQISAGLLMYRKKNGEPEFLLEHPGGPLFAKKDEGAWSVPKGLIEDREDILKAAQREFEEETGVKPEGSFIELGTVRYSSGKIVHAWAFEGDCDPSACTSNTFSIEWPPHSGREQEFPESDRAEFFAYGEAKKKINPAQIPFLDRLTERLS